MEQAGTERYETYVGDPPAAHPASLRPAYVPSPQPHQTQEERSLSPPIFVRPLGPAIPLPRKPRSVMYKAKIHDLLIYASLIISALALILATRKNAGTGQGLVAKGKELVEKTTDLVHVVPQPTSAQQVSRVIVSTISCWRDANDLSWVIVNTAGSTRSRHPPQVPFLPTTSRNSSIASSEVPSLPPSGALPLSLPLHGRIRSSSGVARTARALVEAESGRPCSGSRDLCRRSESHREVLAEERLGGRTSHLGSPRPALVDARPRSGHRRRAT